MMKPSILIPTLCLSFVSSMAYGQQCQQKKEQAHQECSPQQLEQARIVLDQANKTLGQAGANAQMGGVESSDAVQNALNNVTAGQQSVNAFHATCTQAISDCSQSCSQEQAQKAAQMQMGEAQRALQNGKSCTEGEPKQNADKAKQASMDMGQVLGALAQLLQALMGMGGGAEDIALGDECTPSPTNSVAQIAANPRCSTDTAANSPSSDFVTGDYRSKAGTVGGSEGFTAAGVEHNKIDGASAGAGGGGGGMMGMGGMGGMMPASAGGPGNRSSNEKGDKQIPIANSFGGGGGGGKGGGGGGSGSKSAPGAVSITRSSLDGENQLQAAVEKAMQQRGLASDDPMGGITGAHSLDNFLKVEKRIQMERNKLNEL